MDFRLPLLASALLINSVHGALLAFHKVNRKWTLSEHAVLGKNSYRLYVAGHLLNGALILLFAKLYFLDTVHMPGLFVLISWVVVFEYLQALLPAKGKTNAAHTATALVMWISFILFGLLCIVLLPADSGRKLVAAILYAGLFGSFAYASRHRHKLYFYQMTMVMLFYAALIVLVF